MVGPVKHRFRRRTVVIGPDRIGKALAGLLRRERHETGIAAERRGYRTGFVIIRCHDAHAAFLRDMAMRLDTARHHDLPGGINHVVCVGDVLGHGDDTAVADTDIGMEGFGRGGDQTASDCQIMSHDHPFVPSG